MENKLKEKKVSIIIPAYNEEKIIGQIIDRVLALNLDYEILVIDDGSTDKTFEVAKSSGAKAIKHPYNKGYGAALKTGICLAREEIIFIMDADGQHNPEDIPKFVSCLDKYDMVVGARTKDSHLLLFRKPWKKLLGAIANYLSDQKIPDLNSGFRALKKEKVKEFNHILPNGFSFSTTLTLAFFKAGYNVKYVPIKTAERRGRRSSVNFLRDGLQTILLMIRVIVLFNPLKIFIPTAFLLLIFGFLFTVYGILRFRSVPGVGIITVLSGLIIFFFGILADQIAALRRQLK